MTDSFQKNELHKRIRGFCGFLSAPTDHADLEVVDASNFAHNNWKKIARSGLKVGDYGAGDEQFFLKADSDRIYPVIGEFPILLEPECLIPVLNERDINLKSPQYHEAYTEMQHYNATGNREKTHVSENIITRLMGGLKPGIKPSRVFPDPPKLWVDAQHDSLSQHQAYSFLSDLKGKRFVQLGGSGAHCIKALLAGASDAILLTPMLGEAEFAKSLAKEFGVDEHLFCVIAVGEELPFKDSSIDLIYSGGCLHHMRTEMAFAEFKRVLAPEGRFACVDPWKTKLHKIGTKVLGKRETDVFCRPIDPDRLAPVSIFNHHSVTFNGPLLRYLFLGLSKFGINFSPANMLKFTKAENSFFLFFGLKESGGSILITGTK